MRPPELVLCGLGLLITVGCQPRPERHPDLAASDRAVPAPAEIARQLSLRGDHLTASRYWEAALAEGAGERDALPALIAAEIRAGRLRAARTNVRRLEQLAPDRPEIRELRSLLDDLLAQHRPEGLR